MRPVSGARTAFSSATADWVEWRAFSSAACPPPSPHARIVRSKWFVQGPPHHEAVQLLEPVLGVLAERLLERADDLADGAVVAHGVDDVGHEVFGGSGGMIE